MSQGRFPAHWRSRVLGDLGEISGGGTPSTKEPGFWDGDIPWLVPSEVTKTNGLFISRTERRITNDGLANCGAKLLPSGTVLMTSRATIGEVVINTLPMATNQGFINTICKNETVHNELLAYWIKSNKQTLQARAHGVTFREITKSNFKTIPIHLPPIPEQRTIARALRAVQEAREARRWEAALERERKAALMDYLFTHGTRGEPRKHTEIGQIPQSWRIMRLKEISEEFISGGTPSTDDPRYWDGDIPWTTSAPISDDDILLNCGQRFISKVGLKNSATHLVPKDNLLVGTRVGVGKAVVNLIDIAISQDLTGLVLNYKIVNPDFIAYQFKTARVKVFFFGRKRGTTIKGIARLDLESLLLSIPSIFEQYEISGILKACDAKIAALEQEAAVLEELFRAMLEELMTGRLSALPLVEAEVTP